MEDLKEALKRVEHECKMLQKELDRNSTNK